MTWTDPEIQDVEQLVNAYTYGNADGVSYCRGTNNLFEVDGLWTAQVELVTIPANASYTRGAVPYYHGVGYLGYLQSGEYVTRSWALNWYLWLLPPPQRNEDYLFVSVGVGYQVKLYWVQYVLQP